MKLKNKKTGEIGYPYFQNWKEITCVIVDENAIQIAEYTSLAELNEEWEDYEEPKEYWYISDFGYVFNHEINNKSVKSTIEEMKSIGNYFETKEEAEKAVEKLKAFKRLKDNGMIKYSFHKEKTGIDLDFYTLTILAPRDKDSLDLLFGGEK